MASIEIRDAAKITNIENWLIGNGARYGKDVDNPLKYNIYSPIPEFIETTTNYLRANFIPYIARDDDDVITDEAIDYPRSFLMTPAARQIQWKLGDFS